MSKQRQGQGSYNKGKVADDLFKQLRLQKLLLDRSQFPAAIICETGWG